MKILIIGPSWVGDMVMSQSLYITLKENYSDAVIDVLAPAWCKPILERMPEVNQAIEMPVGHGTFGLKKRWEIGRELAIKEYDRAYILPNSAKSALIPLFAGIAKRIGWKGEFRYGLLNDLRPDKHVFQYMVERYVALAYSKETMSKKVQLDNCPKPLLTVNSNKQKQAIEKLNLVSSKPIVGMCPGAEFGPAKRWPESHYAQVADTLIAKGYQIWLFGSQKDEPVTTKIIDNISPENRGFCISLAGKTSLIEAVDLLAVCETVISNDSGLMHVSAAVGCNIVAIYGSTSPKYTPPLTDKLELVQTNIDCRPCFKRECPLGHLKCLTELQADKVIQAIENLNNRNNKH